MHLVPAVLPVVIDVALTRRTLSRVLLSRTSCGPPSTSLQETPPRLTAFTATSSHTRTRASTAAGAFAERVDVPSRLGLSPALDRGARCRDAGSAPSGITPGRSPGCGPR